jgi:hypothetical protein
MGSGADYRGRWIRSRPPGKRIADCIFADGETSFLATRFQPGASFQISGRKNNSGYRRGLCIGNQSEFFDLGYQS